MLNTEGEVIWYILLQKITKGFKLIMPDKQGNFEKLTGSGYIISWPRNPHFDGKSRIIYVLQDFNQFELIS